ncbi:MAG: glycoside hydrolase family 78 protein [Gorillibacterium sp.]|nr:glycoside hydrolase family 78 protein [Gorillibacterium sp.]
MFINNLKCEYRDNPLGIDSVQPRLSWLIQSKQRGEQQTAYRILVASSQELLNGEQGDLWDTGKVLSNRTIQVEYDGEMLHSRMNCYWKVLAWDMQGKLSEWSEAARWTMGLLEEADWQAHWIGIDSLPNDDTTIAEGTVPAPRYLRNTFSISGAVRTAVLYVTSLGVYEMHLNGKRVGDHLLAPEWTNYHKRIQYQTYEVTDILASGVNSIAAVLGNGWCCGLWQFWPPKIQTYSDQPYLLLQLEIEMESGQRYMILSDDKWKGITSGPIRYSGLYEGETYNALMEIPGWDTAMFDDQGWRKVRTFTRKFSKLVWQRSEPIRVTEEISPLALTEPKPGVYVFDMGQNMVGWCRLSVQNETGATIVMKHNEMLNSDGTVYMDNLHAGHLGKGDRQIIRYTCKGASDEVYEPHFTYMGFRYVEVTGLKARPSIHLLTGRVFHTSFQEKGSFTCSNPLVNRLVENIQWSQRGNMMGIPTDCPQRDERCGYSGDAQFFMPTAIYNMDMAAFLSKWLVDLCQDSQHEKGYYGDHAPDYGPGGSNVGWQDAGIIIPYIAYQTYGDTRILREHYKTMKCFLQYLDDTSNRNHTRGPGCIGNGDWLNLGGGASPEVIGSAYYFYVYQLMSEIAEAIGEITDAGSFLQRAELIKAAFIEHYLTAEGQIVNSSQTGFALCFTMGLVPDSLKEQLVERFRAEMERFNGRLATGFIGTPRLLPALHQAGLDDLAYRLLLGEEYPSWLYPVTLGATTIWERWDGWTPDRGFQDSGMNSFNHYAFGSVGEYLFGIVGGIKSLEPGYRKIHIQPVIRQGITWASTTYDSISGQIKTSWKVEGNQIKIDVSIPANTIATVYLPTGKIETVYESGLSVTNSIGVKVVGFEKDSVVLHVLSGSYCFHIDNAVVAEKVHFLRK